MTPRQQERALHAARTGRYDSTSADTVLVASDKLTMNIPDSDRGFFHIIFIL